MIYLYALPCIVGWVELEGLEKEKKVVTPPGVCRPGGLLLQDPQGGSVAHSPWRGLWTLQGQHTDGQFFCLGPVNFCLLICPLCA